MGAVFRGWFSGPGLGVPISSPIMDLLYFLISAA